MAGESKEDSRDAVGAHELLVGAAALVPNAALCQIPAARSAWPGRPASSICVSLLPHVDRPALSTREDGDWTLGRDLVAPCVSPCSLVVGSICMAAGRTRVDMHALLQRVDFSRAPWGLVRSSHHAEVQ